MSISLVPSAKLPIDIYIHRNGDMDATSPGAYFDATHLFSRPRQAEWDTMYSIIH
jgi:hypothetical protein